MTKKKTYSRLVEKEQELSELLQLQQLVLQNKVEHVLLQLQPVNVGLQVAKTLLTRKTEQQAMLNAGANFLVDLITKKWLFRKSGWLMKQSSSFITKNIVSHLMSNLFKQKSKRLNTA